MDPERCRRMEELYHAALELDPGQRGAFLSDRCREDEGLRRELESLLAEGDNPSGPISQSELQYAAERCLEDSDPELRAGELLGPYRIESLLGAGGMGRVYKARDTRLGRSVAIKISSAQFGERFEHEARATSALNHPHICSLYDVGSNYLVMELVEGSKL